MFKSGELRKVVVNNYKDHQGSVTNVNEARDIHNNATYISYHNALPKSELRPICFRYQPPVQDFIGREKELNFLKQKLCIENPRIMVVSGLGGIGKTQLVKKFIEKNREFYRNIVWINSQGDVSIEEEFKILAESELDIVLNTNNKEKDFRCIIGLVFDKLSTARTLIVFDNVDIVSTVNVVLDICAVVVKPHIVITSRIQEFSETVNFRKLEVLSSEEAVDYISLKLNDENDNDSLTDKIKLAETLKNLPLALRQATGHIKYHKKRDGSYRIRNYITDFNKYREQTLSSDLFQKDMLNQYKETIFTTWKVTMDAIKSCEPHGELALRILRTMAYFDNIHILRELFFNLEGLSDEVELRKSDVMSAVALICNYSMVDDYEHQSVMNIHKLVQEVIKIQLENEQRSEPTLRDCLQLISQMEDNENFKVCLAHGISVYLSALRFRELVIEFDRYPTTILRNLNETGNYLRAFSFANEINEQVTTILGVSHRRTTQLQFEIAELYRNLGQYLEAFHIYEKVLEKRKTVLGEHHSSTVIAKNNIINLYGDLNRYSEAFKTYKGNLKKQKIILGEDHPHTFLTRHNTAYSYGALSRYFEALLMFGEVLIKKRILAGDDNFSTIVAKRNYADFLSNFGEYSEAHQIYEEVLEKQNVVLGEGHPSTIATKHNIANLYKNMGKYSEALQVDEDVLEKMNIILGDDHPDTISTKNNIADLNSKLGKYPEALQVYEGILEKQKIRLGEGHPNTIMTKHNIACSYTNLGKNSEALQMYEDILEKRVILLGENHSDPINIKNDIADSYSNLCKYFESLHLYEKLLEKSCKVLVEEHQGALAHKNDIANSYRRLGKYSQGLKMCEEVLEMMKIVWGEDHPHVIVIKNNIAHCYSRLGKYSEALQMYKEILERPKTNKDHPDTILTLLNIANLYGNLGKNLEALQIYEESLEKMKIILSEDDPVLIGTKCKIADLRNKLDTSSSKDRKCCLFAMLYHYVARFCSFDNK